MSSMYDNVADAALEEARAKVNALAEENKHTEQQRALIVLYRDQAYRVHNIMNSGVNMYALSALAYWHEQAKDHWHIGDITSVEYNDHDPEFISVLDQILYNDAVPFHYAPVPMPRYARHKQYVVIQLDSHESTL